jgi:hypothetical protein
MDQVQDESIPLVIKLTVLTSGGDVTAIINTNGLCYVNLQRVILFCQGGLPSQLVNIFSPHYEPL